MSERVSDFLDIMRAILLATNDIEVDDIKDSVFDLCSGWDDDEKEAIREMIFGAAYLKEKELERDYFKSKHIHPLPPEPDFIHNKIGYIDIPSASGVYFFWADTDSVDGRKKIVYIGKSKNLKKRITKHHDNLYDDDIAAEISFLLFPEEKLDYIEAYYIGMYKPERNFPSSYA